jgi:hypothetical protein
MNTMPLEVLEASLKEGLYTSIGSYPKFMVVGRVQCLCWDCVQENLEQIRESVVSNDTKGDYYPLYIEVNWENPELYCDECSGRIESAYAEPEAA